MEKLQLKHLAPYLPYELKFINKDGVILRMDALSSMDYNVWAHTRYIKGERYENDINNKYFSSQNCSGGGYYLKQVKPILRPMSDLSKPCLTDGETPILELAKIATRRFLADGTNLLFKVVDNCCVIKFPKPGMWFRCENIMTLTMFNRTTEYTKTVMDQLELFQYLFEHHFDVFGLIDKGLAIDMNTLEI